MLNPEKVGIFIKKLRKDNHLTQQQLADKYGITYQAVSKWENGINLPDITLLQKISKDFNVSIEDLLAGDVKIKKERHNIILVLSVIIISILLVVGTILIIKNINNKSFYFKTLTTNCKEFKVSGSIAYDKNKSSIYISNIDYCGVKDDTVYKKVECVLYEKDEDINKKISECKYVDNDITLEEYLKDVEININNYKHICTNYNNDSLYLEINATNMDNKVITYKIPLSLNEDC